jgi:signal transduction histidine kinase
VLAVYEGRLRNCDIHVETRGYAQQPVECFEGDIRQVLANVVGNAIDAMPQGGRLLIRSRKGTDWNTGRVGLILTVADNGCGIDREGQAKLFEAFFTTKGIGGIGLGLWISAEIMDRHQGRIRVRSSQDPNRRGTIVTLFLPIAASED